jgi:hypothetical protein
MRKFLIAAALVSLTALPAFAGNSSRPNTSVTANANNSVVHRPSTPVSVPTKPTQPPSIPSRPSTPSPRR